MPPSRTSPPPASRRSAPPPRFRPPRRTLTSARIRTCCSSPAAAGMLVPPDPLRRFVDRPQLKAVIGANNVDNDHGFDFVSAAENTASAGNASYYAWNPSQTPGFRFINIDTNSEGGQTAEGVASGSSNGNIDDPQFQWLKQELDAAQAADKLIVLFGHHPVRSMNTEIADEQAGVHAGALPPDHAHGDTPEHNHDPGCDRDPRLSVPIHLGAGSRPRRPARELRRAARELPQRDRLRRRPHPRAQADPVQPGGRLGLVGDQHLGDGGLAAAAPPDRGDGQPRRHSVDLRHRPRRGLSGGGAGRQGPPLAST